MSRTVHRLTRLTNAFSKKLANHAHMVALHLLVQLREDAQNGRMHARDGSGTRDTIWSMTDLMALVDRFEAQPRKKAGRKPKTVAQ
jgi:hypothetical protein